jgi:hypothetical protein
MGIKYYSHIPVFRIHIAGPLPGSAGPDQCGAMDIRIRVRIRTLIYSLCKLSYSLFSLNPILGQLEFSDSPLHSSTYNDRTSLIQGPLQEFFLYESREEISVLWIETNIAVNSSENSTYK